MRLILLVFLAVVAMAQPGPPGGVNFVSTDPSGACGTQPLRYNIQNGKLWGCQAGTWTLVSGSGKCK